MLGVRAKVKRQRRGGESLVDRCCRACAEEDGVGREEDGIIGPSEAVMETLPSDCGYNGPFLLPSLSFALER